MHSIIRTKKHKSIASLTTRKKHTYRWVPTPNSDPAKRLKNKVLFGDADYSAGLEKKLNEYVEAGGTVRKNAVMAIEYLLTASPEFFDEGPKNERNARLKKWCDAQIEFMKKEHGEENILCMYLHLDEKTPHIEVYAVPMDKNGKLNCKHFLGARTALSILQTRYAQHNKDFGLMRGMTNSRATHQDVKKFYAQITQPVKVTKENLQDAVKIKPPTMRNFLNLQNYINTQEKIIYQKVAKLFLPTIYENKLIHQAKKIMRDWKRMESVNEKLKYKLKDEQEALKASQKIQAENFIKLEQLLEDNDQLNNQLQELVEENQVLKSNTMPGLPKNKY